MTTAQVIETSVTNNNIPIHDYFHLDDHTQPSHEMTPGFKPFTMIIMLMTMTMNKVRIKTKYKDLSEIVEAAKRIVNPINNRRNKLTLLPIIRLLVFLVVAARDPVVIAAIPMAILKATVPKNRRKTTFLRIPKEVTKFAVYGTNINDLSAS